MPAASPDPDRYVEQHEGYARALALKEARRLPSQLDVDELIQLARIGLLQAARAFEEGRGCAFTTFAYPRIRGAILDGVRHIQGIPKNAARAAARRALESDYLGQTLPGHGATAEEAAALVSRAAQSLSVIFLASQIGDGDQALEAESDDEPVADVVERRDLFARVREACGDLPARQARVIEMLYLDELTTTECARRLGVNKAQVSRDHAKAIERLRAVLAPVDERPGSAAA